MSAPQAVRRSRTVGGFLELQVHLYAGGVATAGMSEGPIFSSRPLRFSPHPTITERTFKQK